MTQANAAPLRRVPRVMVLVLALALPAERLCASGKTTPPTSATVTATAYSSSPKQTDGSPFHGAWGDRLDDVPSGHRPIAVSRDLVAKGLGRGKLVKIRIAKNPPVTASACGREKICCMNSRGKFAFCVLRVTSKPAASEIKNAGTWLTRPSPIVKCV